MGCLKQIELVCAKNEKYNSKSAVYFHGWIMSKVSEEFATNMHQTGVNSLNIYSYHTRDTINFVISLLSVKAVEELEKLLMDSKFKEFVLEGENQRQYLIIDKKVNSLTEKELARNFYASDSPRGIEIQLLTPTAFKTKGDYYNLPDLRFLFQSLMKKYNAIFEGSEQIDLDLLDEILKNTKLVDFSIYARRYYIHRSFIQGCIGKLTIYCKGSQTIVNYINTLLRFAEYAGIGVKTSLGMGAVKLLTGSDNSDR